MLQQVIMCSLHDKAAGVGTTKRLENLARSGPQREAQFIRLRDRIEERAARKLLAREFEGTPPGIILRSIDFQN